MLRDLGQEVERVEDGTTALTYGPLVFSLPVPENAEIVQRIPEAEAAGLRDFYGYQYDPVDLASAKRPLTLPVCPGSFSPRPLLRRRRPAKASSRTTTS